MPSITWQRALATLVHPPAGLRRRVAARPPGRSRPTPWLGAWTLAQLPQLPILLAGTVVGLWQAGYTPAEMRDATVDATDTFLNAGLATWISTAALVAAWPRLAPMWERLWARRPVLARPAGRSNGYLLAAVLPVALAVAAIGWRPTERDTGVAAATPTTTTPPTAPPRPQPVDDEDVAAQLPMIVLVDTVTDVVQHTGPDAGADTMTARVRDAAWRFSADGTFLFTTPGLYLIEGTFGVESGRLRFEARDSAARDEDFEEIVVEMRGEIDLGADPRTMTLDWADTDERAFGTDHEFGHEAASTYTVTLTLTTTP